MNDEINKLIREKGHWEKHIHETLGGPDYAKTRAKVTDSEGKEVAGATGKGSGTAANCHAITTSKCEFLGRMFATITDQRRAPRGMPETDGEGSVHSPTASHCISTVLMSLALGPNSESDCRRVPLLWGGKELARGEGAV